MCQQPVKRDTRQVCGNSGYSRSSRPRPAVSLTNLTACWSRSRILHPSHSSCREVVPQPLYPWLTDVKLSTDRPNRGNALSREHQDGMISKRIVHDLFSVLTGRDHRYLIPADDHHQQLVRPHERDSRPRPYNLAEDALAQAVGNVRRERGDDAQPEQPPRQRRHPRTPPCSVQHHPVDHLMTRSAAFTAHHRRLAETPPTATMGFLVQSVRATRPPEPSPAPHQQKLSHQQTRASWCTPSSGHGQGTLPHGGLGVRALGCITGRDGPGLGDGGGHGVSMTRPNAWRLSM